jgi:archaellum biogenesis ATPase FlaH
MMVHSINPAEKSFEESLGEILYLAKRVRPKLLVIDGIDVPLILSGAPNEVLLHVRNLQLIARMLNSVILVIDYSDKPNDALVRLSDIVIVSSLRDGEVCISAARKGKPYETQCLSINAVEEYRESLARRLREAVGNSIE